MENGIANPKLTQARRMGGERCALAVVACNKFSRKTVRGFHPRKKEKKMRFLSLFAGIGGFDLGLERAGMECAGQVEIDPYCQAVLAKHWPRVKRMGDIREVKGNEFGAVDLVCGGFPCQPFSLAGLRAGSKDNRYLWPEMFRLIQALRPTWVIGENVPGFIEMELNSLCVGLEDLYYEVRPFIIPACAVDAPHERKRVWIIAHFNGQRCPDGGWMSGPAKQDGRQIFASDADSEPMERPSESWEKCVSWPAEPDVGRVVHGVSAGLDSRNRLRALGNSVVPQIPEIIGRAIMQTEERENLKQATSSCAAPGLQPVGPNARVI
jgi:DNA (cytosine-5)-methyltransferase 1